MKNNEITTVVTTVGEFVGRLHTIADYGFQLERPRMIVHGEEGMGFAHGICATGEDAPENVEFFVSGICFTTKTNDDVAAAWLIATDSGPKVYSPEQKIIV
jgi:hypothetical protein